MPAPFKLNRSQVGEHKAINPFSLDHVFGSGVHKDETVLEVIDSDRGFITYCMENIEGWLLDDEAYHYYRTGQFLTKVERR